MEPFTRTVCKTEDTVGNTYVMQGKAETKALDIYHLIFAPTYACNSKCKHCYLPDHKHKVMPKNIALGLIDQFSEMVMAERGQYGGIFHVKGGEPFVVPYLWNIVDKLAELKTMRFMITTNGTFTQTKGFQHLNACKASLDGNLTVIVSLEGPTEKTDAILRGVGHFKQAMTFLAGLQENEINFHLNCVLHKQNIDCLSEYVSLAKRYGASQVNFLNFVPRGHGSALHELQLSHSELYEKLQQLYENSNEDTKILLSGSLPDIIHSNSCDNCALSNECVAAYRGLFYITPDGSVFTCPNITFGEFIVGNIQQQDLLEISNNLSAVYKQIIPHSSQCTCTGERILYEKTENIDNLRSLSILNRNINCNQNVTSKPTLSYCFNRNW